MTRIRARVRDHPSFMNCGPALGCELTPSHRAVTPAVTTRHGSLGNHLQRAVPAEPGADALW